MNKIVRFNGNERKRNSSSNAAYAGFPRSGGRSRRSGRSRVRTGWGWAIIALIAAGGYIAEHYQVSDRLVLALTAPKVDTLRATFPYCTDSARTSCIVDGDTFWLSGEKIRISDIDTPELSPPRCEAERVKGEAAKRRLRELLNAGPFSLVAGWRSEDRYGRKLRMVTREGRSIGEVLVGEGLARRWEGSRRSWCE